MQSFNKIYRPFMFSALIIAPVLAIVRIVLMNAFYRSELQNYTTETHLPTMYSILLIACCVALFSVIFIIKPKNGQCDSIPESTVSSLFASSLCGFFFISSAFLIVYFTPELLTVNGAKLFIQSQGGVCFGSVISALIFSIPSAIFFLLAESSAHSSKGYIKILSFFPIFWCIAYLIYIYFDRSVVLNNSEKLACQLSMIFTMLYLTSECRYRVNLARPRLHLALSLVCIVILASYSIPNIVLTATLVLPFDINTLYSGIQFAVLLYIIVRTIQFSKYTPKASLSEA